MKLDKQYWTQRYINQDTPWQLKEISKPLKHIVDAIDDKSCRILIPGGGNSKEAAYLLQQGFTDVTVIDISKAPLDSLSDLYPDSKSLNLIEGDFFNHRGSYDLILEQTFFCALELRFRESYPKKCQDLLIKGGHLQGVLFNFTQTRDEPPYGGNKKEYYSLFQPYFEILQLEKSQISESSREGKELIFNFRK